MISANTSVDGLGQGRGALDGDGTVGVVDFLVLLADWGACAEACCLADLDLDGTVGVDDFLSLLAGWG